VKYGKMCLAEEEQFSAYSFDYADVGELWKHLDLYEEECLGLVEQLVHSTNLHKRYLKPVF
jgi:glycyl-tRNA synthetase alpha chain